MNLKYVMFMICCVFTQVYSCGNSFFAPQVSDSDFTQGLPSGATFAEWFYCAQLVHTRTQDTNQAEKVKIKVHKQIERKRDFASISK